MTRDSSCWLYITSILLGWSFTLFYDKSTLGLVSTAALPIGFCVTELIFKKFKIMIDLTCECPQHYMLKALLMWWRSCLNWTAMLLNSFFIIQSVQKLIVQSMIKSPCIAIPHLFFGILTLSEVSNISNIVLPSMPRPPQRSLSCRFTC